MSIERDAYQMIQNVSMAYVTFITDVLAGLLNNTESLQGKQSIMALQDCLNRGGVVSDLLIENKDLVELQALLEKHKVVYTVVQDMENKDASHILFRNSDMANVRQVLKDFDIAHGIPNEVELKDFLSANINNQIHAFQDISKDELEVFRFHALQNGLTFAVQNLPGDKANILFNEASLELADKTFKQMAWDTTGGREQMVRDKVKQAIADRDDIEDAVYSGKGKHIIVDKNAQKAIITDRDGAVTYRIVKKDKSEFMPFGDGFADKDGNRVLNMEEGTVLVPMKTFQRNQLDFQDNVMDEIQQMQQPTIITAADLEKSTPEIQKIVAEKGTIYPHGYSAYEGRMETQTMRNLTQDEMAFFMKRGKELGLTFFAAGKDVAYFTYEQDKVETIRKELTAKFYKDEPEMDRFAREMRYAGKSEVEKAVQETKEPMYLIDAKKPENILVFEQNTVTVKSGKKQKKLDRKKDVEQINDFVVAMAVPVAINAGEINADNRAEILKTHVKSTEVSNLAEQELIKADASKCKLFEDALSRNNEYRYEQLVRDDNDETIVNPLGLSDDELALVNSDPHIQAAAERCRQAHTTTYEVSRSVLDSLVQEADHERQERTERTEREERNIR